MYERIKIKEDYDMLLKSGMFFEFHPELSGNWEKDKNIILYEYVVEEKIISKDLAFIAFDKDFDCYGWSAYLSECIWHEEEDTFELLDFDNLIIPEKYWDERLKFCPQSLVQKWFRDKHNLHIEIELASDCELNIFNPYIYQFAIYKDCKYNADREFYESYEECLEAALLFCFSLI